MIYLVAALIMLHAVLLWKNDKCGIVTGVSLPMLVEVINYRLCNGENANVQDAMEKAVEASVAGAQKFHKSQVESETDDEGDDL